MPSETRIPATAMVMRQITKMPVLVANQVAPLGSPSVANNGWNNSTDRMLP